MAGPQGTYHGSHSFHRGMDVPCSKYFASGKFGRLFPTLPALALPGVNEAGLRAKLNDLGAPGGPMDPAAGQDKANDKIPAGFVFLGQFIDHDVTLDTTSSLERQNDPEGIVNFRTPLLELDNVYGSGPEVDPWLYEGDKLLVEHEFGRGQIPRNSKRTALIGDPRNDENLIISQLQLVFLKLHNKVIDALAADGVPEGGARFREAQRIVRWLYQWVIVHEFLPLTVGKKLVDDVYTADCSGHGRRFYNWRHEPFIPVEFAVAAYRFGHSQVPAQLQVNKDFEVVGKRVPIFDRNAGGPPGDPDDLSGFGLRAARRWVNWKFFFATTSTKPQPSRRIDRVLSKPLFDLPFITPTPESPSSLAARNLLRGQTFGLPSGQSVACAMCIEPLAKADLAEVAALGFDERTPLFYYILEEARVVGKGQRLGPVGGRIIAEVLIGLLEGDRMSYVRANPKWTPADEILGLGADVGMADLINLAES